MALQKCKLNYSWIIVFLCALIMFLNGFVGGYHGQWLSAVTEGLGFSRTSFSLSNSFRFGATAIVNVFFAMLLHRWGVKKTFAFGFAFMILAMLTYATADQVWLFYVAGSLFGIGIGFSGSSIVSILLKQWLIKGLGTVMGFVFSCSGLGAAVGVQVMTPILFQEGNPLGFRDAYKLCALILLISAVLVIVLVRESKEDPAPFPQRNPTLKKSDAVNSPKGFTFFTVICVFLCNALLMGINSVYSTHMRDVGLNNDIIKWATSVLSVMLILSKTCTGVLFDKLGLRVVLILCQMATLIGFGILAFMDAQAGTAAIIFAMVFSFALPLETIVPPLIVEELFDRRSYNKVLGYMIAASNIGFAVGPPVVNKVYDALGTYIPAIFVCMLCMTVIMVAFQIVIALAHKEEYTVKRSV